MRSMKQHNKSKTRGILYYIFVPMFLVMLIQSTIFMYTVVKGGITERLEQNAYAIFNDRVISRKHVLETEMNRKWNQLDSSVASIGELYGQYLQNYEVDTAGFLSDAALQRSFLGDVATPIVTLLRENKVNGAFLILDSREGSAPVRGEDISKFGLCIRDLDQNSGYKGNEDLLIERSPMSVSRKLGYTLDSWWKSTYSFPEGGCNDYFYLPLAAGKDYPGVPWSDLGFWCKPHQISGADTEMLSYSVPLRDAEGEVYGVLGIEISTAYIASLLPGEELGSNSRGSYVLGGIEDGAKECQAYIDSGVLYKQLFNRRQMIHFGEQEAENCYGIDGTEACGSVHMLQIYGNNSPYEKNGMALVGLLERSQLLSFYASIKNALLLACTAALVLGVTGILLAAQVLATPIVRLSERVRGMEPHGDFSLEKLGIREIDDLTASIDALRKAITENEQKLSSIIRMTGLPIGAFEIDLNSEEVLLGEGFLDVLGDLFTLEEQKALTTLSFFEEAMKRLGEGRFKVEEDNVTGLYSVPSKGTERFIRIRWVIHNNKALGIVMDVTDEILEKQKIEHERDHDILTDLYNRRAFQRKLYQLFEKPETLGVAAMVMMDLDNLKYINDTYGHDYGDQYIRSAATVLASCCGEDTLLARQSGDEFTFFIYNRESREEVQKTIQALRNALSQASMIVPGNATLRVRISGGIAWYPQDATTPLELIKYADFSMYQVKRNQKGAFSEFDLNEYNKDSYLLQYKEELSRLIEEELVDYYLQPIIEMQTGNIFGYEALMRPRDSLIQSPAEVLSLARTQGKLYQVEKLTWNKALETFEAFVDHCAPGTRFFINSVPNQMLQDEDYELIYSRFQKILPRVVLELTEEDRLDDTYTAEKLMHIRSWGAAFAIDDYGSGYNSQALLLEFTPQFIKLDMQLVRDIDRDENRQEVVKSILEYTSNRNIAVVAEGVETKEEFNFLRKLGIDLVQGYLLQRPQPCPKPLSDEVKKLFQSKMK